MDENEINTQAKNLTKAIFQHESGTNYNAKGDAGTSSGAGQWQAATWKGQAKDVLGDENAPMTPENQSVVAQGTIRKLIKQGKNAADIAAIWNSGSDKDWQDKVGTTTINGQQIKYNVPKYVKDVTDLYHTYKGQPSDQTQSNGSATQSPTSPGAFRYDVPGNKISVADAQKQADQAKQVSDSTGSFGGVLGNTVKGVGDLVTSSEQALGNTIGGIVNTNELSGKYADIATQNAKTLIALQKQIKDHEAQGLDTTNLKKAYNSVQDHVDEANKSREEAMAGANKTTGQVAGELGGTALDLLSAGTYGAASEGLKTGELAAKAPGAVPTVVKGVEELAKKPVGLFTKEGATKLAAGATLGYGQDVTQGLQGNRGEDRTGGAAFIPGLGTALGGGLPALSEGYKSIQNSTAKDLDTLVGTVTQGKTADIEKAKTALGNIDTSAIKTYSDLKNTLDTKIKTISDKLDSALDTNTATTKLKDLGNDVKVGDTTVTHNYVKDALSELKNHYRAINDPVGEAKINQLTDKAKTTGLTVKEVNNLAKEHGNTLNAFNANGQAASGLTKQAAENTRSGLKSTARGLFGNKAYEAADEQLSNLIRTRKLVNDVNEGVNKLKQKVNPRTFGEKAGRLLFQATDKLTGGGLKGYIQSFLPRGDGLKVMNALDLEKGLKGNLKLIRDALDAPKGDIAEKLQNLVDNISPKKPSLIPLTPPRDRSIGTLTKEIGQRNAQARLPTKPGKL